MKITAHSRKVRDASTAVGWSGSRTVTIDRSPENGGMGLGYNGGELLFLAVVACFHNDLHRTAAKQGVRLHRVDVDVEGELGGEPMLVKEASLSAKIEADASDEQLARLVEATLADCTILNSLRQGIRVGTKIERA